MSNKVINPLKGLTDRPWFFEQQVYDPDSIARAIKSTDGSGNVPKVIIYEDEQGQPPTNEFAGLS